MQIFLTLIAVGVLLWAVCSPEITCSSLICLFARRIESSTACRLPSYLSIIAVPDRIPARKPSGICIHGR